MILLQTMQNMGNAKAKRIYEGRLPQNYRRPREHDGQYAPLTHAS